MATIVTNGRKQLLRPGHGDALSGARYPRIPNHGWQRRKYCIGRGIGPNGKFLIYGINAIKRVDENIGAIREHFGTNMTDAIRLALHLTAQAIRKNKANVEV